MRCSCRGLRPYRVHQVVARHHADHAHVGVDDRQAAWSILVLTGWAQSIIDVIFWLHFIEPPYHVGPFSWPRALGLIAATSAIGYLLGGFVGVIWNRLVAART